MRPRTTTVSGVQVPVEEVLVPEDVLLALDLNAVAPPQDVPRGVFEGMGTEIEAT